MHILKNNATKCIRESFTDPRVIEQNVNLTPWEKRNLKCMFLYSPFSLYSLAAKHLILNNISHESEIYQLNVPRTIINDLVEIWKNHKIQNRHSFIHYLYCEENITFPKVSIHDYIYLKHYYCCAGKNGVFPEFLLQLANDRGNVIFKYCYWAIKLHSTHNTVRRMCKNCVSSMLPLLFNSKFHFVVKCKKIKIVTEETWESVIFNTKYWCVSCHLTTFLTPTIL